MVLKVYRFGTRSSLFILCYRFDVSILCPVMVANLYIPQTAHFRKCCSQVGRKQRDSLIFLYPSQTLGFKRRRHVFNIMKKELSEISFFIWGCTAGGRAGRRQSNVVRALTHEPFNQSF